MRLKVFIFSVKQHRTSSYHCSSTQSVFHSEWSSDMRITYSGWSECSGSLFSSIDCSKHTTEYNNNTTSACRDKFSRVLRSAKHRKSSKRCREYWPCSIPVHSRQLSCAHASKPCKRRIKEIHRLIARMITSCPPAKKLSRGMPNTPRNHVFARSLILLTTTTMLQIWPSVPRKQWARSAQA